MRAHYGDRPHMVIAIHYMPCIGSSAKSVDCDFIYENISSTRMQSPPKFIPHFVTLTHMRDTKRTETLEHFECEACGEYGTVDDATKVCRPCWRALVLGKVTP